MTDPTKAMLTFVQAGALLTITDRWVRTLVERGFIPVPIDGRVQLAAAVAGYVKSLKDEGRRNSNVATASRKQEMATQEIELRIAQRLRILTPTEDTFAAIDAIIGPLKSELVGLPSRITRDLELREKIESELDGALGRASIRIEETRAAFSAGLDPLETIDQVPAGSMGSSEPRLPRKQRVSRPKRSVVNAV